MQGLVRAARGSALKLIKQCSHQESIASPTKHRKGLNEARVARSHSMQAKVLQNTTVAQVLATKGEDKVGSWLWCRIDDTVYDAVKQVSLSPTTDSVD